MQTAQADFADEFAADMRRDLDATLLRAFTRLLGSAEAASIAMAQTSVLLQGGTLAWRLDTELMFIELFCDIGLPEPFEAQTVYRLALEANLCRTYPGVFIGVHPESERVVATTSVPAMMLLDEEMCAPALETFACQARELRDQWGHRLQGWAGFDQA